MKSLIVVLVGFLLIFNGCTKKNEIETLPPDAQELLGNIIDPENSNLKIAPDAVKNTLLENEESASAAIPEKPTPQQIQQALANADLYEGDIDDVVGPRTKKAIRTFQEQNDLKVDGKVGPKTWQKLGPHLNRTAPGSSAETSGD